MGMGSNSTSTPDIKKNRSECGKARSVHWLIHSYVKSVLCLSPLWKQKELQLFSLKVPDSAVGGFVTQWNHLETSPAAAQDDCRHGRGRGAPSENPALGLLCSGMLTSPCRGLGSWTASCHSGLLNLIHSARRAGVNTEAPLSSSCHASTLGPPPAEPLGCQMECRLLCPLKRVYSVSKNV